VITEFVLRDLDRLNGYLRDYGIDELEDDDLPKVGFASEHAFGFVMQTDTSHCFLEYLVGDKNCSIEERNDSLNEVVSACVKAARELNFKSIHGITQFNAVVSRAVDHGFSTKEATYQLIYRKV
jgi:hypothetical protein